MKKNKVLLIGWDAADWKIIGPLMAKGHMPALKRLIDKGVYGNISTMEPPFSPMLWSSVATGKTPDKHGVLGFIEIMPDLKGIRPVTVNSRKARAVWNILHHKGYKCNLVGWWPSFPAEPLNGVVVSDRFQKVKKDPKEKNPIPPRTIHPEEWLEELRNLRMFPYELTDAHILPFIPRAAEIDQEKDKGLNPFAKIMAENVSVHNAATKAMRTTEWDFMGVYYDMIDHYCHGFMKFHPPKMASVPQKQYEVYKDVVNSSYRFQDMMLERVMDIAGPDTNIIVMSDHGFESGHKRIVKMPKYPSAPALDHRQFGIFVAAGPDIKKKEKVFGMSLIDIAPTILHMFGLPVGKDMDGKVALDIFKEQEKPEYIDSWDKVEGDFGEVTGNEGTEELSDHETMEQLIELGYIDRPDENIETAILKTKCDIKHNLARVYIGKKDYHTAEKILLELIEEEDPIDVIPFYMDLLTTSLHLADFDRAEEYLKKLRTMDKQFEINTYFSEAKILLGRGKEHEALQVLEEAKNRKPNSEVWYQMGRIYLKLDIFEEAKHAFQTALSFEQDKAKFHRGLAEAYLRLGEYEEAADSALTSIELVKYFAQAHYTLGEALEKMGDLENAKKAFEMAAMLKPRTYHKAEKSIENIEEKLAEPTDYTDKSEFKYRENQIVVVSGLPRSGTSMMMQMLDKGGLEVLTDEVREADESNPKGYYEFEPVMGIHKDNSWLEKGQDKAVKIVAPLLKYLNVKYRYKVIFMKRDLNEVVKSQQKMRGKDTETLPVKLFNAFTKQLDAVRIWKEQEPGVEMIYVDYNEILADPDPSIEKILAFTGVDLDTAAMKGCIDKSLYRNKVVTAAK